MAGQKKWNNGEYEDMSSKPFTSIIYLFIISRLAKASLDLCHTLYIMYSMQSIQAYFMSATEWCCDVFLEDRWLLSLFIDHGVEVA